MGYCIYHFEKGKGQASAIGNHIDRAEGAEHSYKNADASRSHLNRNYEVNDLCKLPLQEAIATRIAEGYKGKRGIRSDAVRYLKHVLTGSHEDMKNIFKDKEKARQWVNDNYRFMCDEFGRENIVRFTLHLDERTPHIHCVTVPLTADGRLSAKEVTGNRKALQERQNRYAERMQALDLVRGIKGSKAKHSTLQDYYKRVNEASNTELELSASPLTPEPPNIEPPSRVDVIMGRTAEWQEQQQQQLSEWVAELNRMLEERVQEVGRSAVEDLQKRRSKDTSLIFAMQHKGKYLTLMRGLEMAEQRAEELTNENRKKFNQGVDAMRGLVNKKLKAQGLKVVIKDGDVELKELKQERKRGRSGGRGM